MSTQPNIAAPFKFSGLKLISASIFSLSFSFAYKRLRYLAPIFKVVLRFFRPLMALVGLLGFSALEKRGELIAGSLIDAFVTGRTQKFLSEQPAVNHVAIYFTCGLEVGEIEA